MPFAQAATGAIGVETLLPLSLEMYHNESLPLNKIIETITINPAKILNIKKGTLVKGSDGDICIFDLEAPWKVDADKLKCHIGIYAYRFDILQSWKKLETSDLEENESLEQLRWLDNDIPIYAFEYGKEVLSIDNKHLVLQGMI